MVRYAKYTVTQGDTLQTIAQHKMGDASLWVNIAKYNKLKHPYIVADPNEKLTNPTVVCYGDSIIIPIEVELTDLANKPMQDDTKAILEELYFGRDISMTLSTSKDKSYEATDGILEMGMDSQGRNIIVAGHYNLIQACLTRLMTIKGTLPLHPEYGSELRQYIGSKITFELLELISLEVQTTLLRDPRVNRVSCKAVNETYNSITLTITLVPTGFDEIVPLVLSLDSGSGAIEIIA